MNIYVPSNKNRSFRQFCSSAGIDIVLADDGRTQKLYSFDEKHEQEVREILAKSTQRKNKPDGRVNFGAMRLSKEDYEKLREMQEIIVESHGTWRAAIEFMMEQEVSRIESQ